MKNIRVFLSENFQFLEVKFSIYLNRRVFVMYHTLAPLDVQLARFMRMTDYTRHDIRGFHNLTFGTNFAC